MKREEYEYMGVRFNINMICNNKWCCRIPGWYYEDNIENSSEAIKAAEDYIEKNYRKLSNS